MSITGWDLLGAAHPKFNVKQAINLTPRNSAIGMFLDTFGNAIPVLKRFASSGKFPVFRIQANWSGTSHTIVSEAKCKSDAKKVEALAKQFPNIVWYLSHSCEHNGDLTKAKKRMAIIREFAPSCVPVNSVWKGAIIQGEINEKHGPQFTYKEDEEKVKLPVSSIQGKYITSWDGSNAPDGDIEGWHGAHDIERCFIRFLWGNRYNGRAVYKPGEPVPPPSQRIDWPSPEYFRAMIALGDRQEDPPLAFPGAKPIKKPLLYKLMSEDHPNQNDVRENKPVLIVSTNAPTCDVVTKDGDKIATLKNEGDFPGGLWRYYSGTASNLWGYQIANRAEKDSGSSWVWFKVGGKIFGPVHPAFRTGYFLS